MTTALKVGALAKRTGLTIRTLHHYDEIGLLSPSSRTPAGHRLYAEDDVARLQSIASLKHLGLPLEEIKACLSHPEYTLEHTLELQIQRIQAQVERQARLLDLVLELRDRLRSAGGVSIDQLTRTIEVTMNYEKYYTPGQMEQLRLRREEVGEARMRAVQQEWADLFAAYGKAMEEGLDPASDEVRALAEKSRELIEEFTGGDAGILQSLGDMYRTEGGQSVMADHGMETTLGLWEYMARARAALGDDGQADPT